MIKLRVAGIDPALQNMGMVKGDLDLTSLVFTPDEIKLIETKPTKVKGIRKNEDDLQRAVTLSEELSRFTEGCTIVFVELPVGSQSARAMVSYGVCIGMFSSLNQGKLVITQASEGKRILTGDKNASKETMLNVACDKYRYLPWIYTTRKGVTTLANKNEHVADAIASVLAGIQTNKFKHLLEVLKVLR